MITIKDIQEGPHVWFAQHRYLVLEVCPRLFIAKRFRDGCGAWHCMEEVEGEYADRGVSISWSLMLSLVGRPMTYADAPIKIK